MKFILKFIFIIANLYDKEKLQYKLIQNNNNCIYNIKIKISL